MNGKLASVIGVLALLASGGVARAQQYQFPPDPISPTSPSECAAIYEQYRTIFERVSARAKAAGDLAWQIVLQSGRLDPQANSLYERASQLHAEASNILSEGMAARLRCMRQVYAYEADRAAEKRKADEQRLGSYGSSGKYAANVGGKVAEESAQNGLKLLEKLRGVPPGLGALAHTLQTTVEIGGMVQDLSGRGGAEGYLSQVVGGVAGLEQWDPLRSFMVNASLGELLNINNAAISALQAEMSAFDESSGLSRLVSDARQAENARFSGNAPEFSGPDGLADDELEAYREHQGMYAGRGEAYEQALATVNREYKRVMGQPAAPKGGGGSAGFRYSAAECQALLQQIQEFYQVLPQYSAAGQGNVIQMGINANQSEYDRGCR